MGPAPVADAPFVGREQERSVLDRALLEAKAGTGTAWVVGGPAGMGKTSLVRWAQERAEKMGFRTAWGYGLKEVNTPLFAWTQVFRGLASTQTESSALTLPSPLPRVTIFEEVKPVRLFEEVTRLPKDPPTLLVVRERPVALRARMPGIAPSTKVLWLSKGEGEERISPSDLDKLGDQLAAHLAVSRRAVVVLTGVDYLSTQNGFPAVLRLVQFLRDQAEEHEGHLVLALNPGVFEKREAGLLEGEGEVVRATVRGDPPPEAPSVPEAPTTTMLRYLDTLEAEAAGRPVLLVVDDLQWADPDSLRAFHFLARNLRKLPVLLLATLRTDDVRSSEEASESPLVEVLDQSEREGTTRRIQLSGMGAEEGADFVRELTGFPPKLGARDATLLDLLRRGGGSPFFLKEMVRQLSRDGLLRTEGNYVVLRPASISQPHKEERSLIPESLRRLVARRLEGLSAEEREILSWAAVVGSEFDTAPLEDLVTSKSSSAVEVMELLSRRESVIDEQGPSKWSFAHPLVWEVTLSEQTSTERARRAERLAEWWAVHRPNDVDTVARLYHEARDGSKGMPWVRKAIDGAVRTRSPGSAMRYDRWLRDLLEVEGVGTEERVRESLAVVARLSDRGAGRSREVELMLRRLQGQVSAGVLRTEIDARLAATSPPKEAKELLERLRSRSRNTEGSRAVQAIIGLATVRLAFIEGRDAEVVSEASRVLSMEEGVPVLARAALLQDLGVALAHLGRREEARGKLEDLRAFAATSEEPHPRGLYWELEAFIAELDGDVQAIRRATVSALVQYREAGLPGSITTGLCNVADALAYEGDLDGARTALDEFRKYTERFPDSRARFLDPLEDGTISLFEGRWGVASKLLEECVEKMVDRGHLEMLNGVRVLLAEAYLGAARPKQAREVVQHAWSDPARLTNYQRPRLLLAEGKCESVEGNVEQAKKKFEEALSLARSSENVFNQGLALNHLARWQEAYGAPQRAATLWAEAKALLDKSGHLPGGWARTWPSPLRSTTHEKAGAQP